ncbi:condensin subunit ScpA [Rhizobiales bacterium GAS191]|nr:condensin subunit ScpA [Rhizobiales bacterium GAS113]SED60961.1 condensin subunit ScpA [Rhizobiales bacterium GAS191]SEE77339.1 condensin subunit ScpA [Rhizobiales bacterium GAS188]
MNQDLFDQDLAEIDRAESDPAFVVDLGGFEGPLDLLLELARRQTVDLAGISILKLAEQYLAFIEGARRIRLELAADYLVMAAWLAYLKSRLLLPDQQKPDEPAAADLAAALAMRLRRLEAMREAAKRLSDGALLGRDVFQRGDPEPLAAAPERPYADNLYDLLRVYATRRERQALSRVTVAKRFVWTLVEAREALAALLGDLHDWAVLDEFLERYITSPRMRPTIRASALAAALEMARDGSLALHQDKAFGPIHVRRAGALAAGAVAAAQPGAFA